MHVHGNQFDPNIQMSALYAAARTEAKREAEQTRKKLQSFSSALAGNFGEGEDFVVAVSEGEGSPGQGRRESQDDEKAQNGRANSESVRTAISEWA
jgi:hypothetical protein